ncbi:MAG: hypothetical protein U1F58_15895 [Burkholderiales bacterium]
MVAAQRLTRIAAAFAALAAAVASAQDLTVDGSCRDGQPHGAYEVRGPAGAVRVVGAFAKGRRTGSFLFWSSGGARVAQLPYDDDVLSGTVALWYAPAGRSGDVRPKLEASYLHGRLSGLKRSWHPDGRLRAEYRYEQGALASARAFAASGKALPEGEARALAQRDLATDDQYYASLDAFVRAHLPHCDAASARLEKG